ARQEADQHRGGLVLRRVVVDLERHLRRAVSVARERAGDSVLDHGGKDDFVADSPCLDHYAVLVLPAQPATEEGDHLVTGAQKWPPYSPRCVFIGWLGAQKWPPYSPRCVFIGWLGAQKWPPYSPRCVFIGWLGAQKWPPYSPRC